jgi:hypothetical protein
MNFYHTKQRTVYYKASVLLEEFKEILKSKPPFLYCKEWSRTKIYIIIHYITDETVDIFITPLEQKKPLTLSIEELYKKLSNEMCSLSTEL